MLMPNSRIIFALFLFLGVCNTSLAQDAISEGESRNNYLFRNDKIDLTTFYAKISPGTSVSQINGAIEQTSILEGGFILNKKIMFGFFSESASKLNRIGVPEEGSKEMQDWIDAGVEVDRLPADADSVYVSYQQSGFHLAYLHQTNKTIFLSVGINIGISGGVKLSQNKNFLG